MKTATSKTNQQLDRLSRELATKVLGVPKKPMLVYEESGEPVKVGDKVEDFRGELWLVTGWQLPHSPASTGRICVRQRSSDWVQAFYPSVFNATWINRTDRG